MTTESKTPTPSFPVELAVRHICEQHRHLARVLKILEKHCAEVSGNGAEPDYFLVQATLNYIGSFCECFHHPAEEEFLFAAMRRHGAPESLLGPAENGHEEGAQKYANLREAFERWRSNRPAGQAEFFDRLQDFLRLQYDHMSYEESTILPSALELLHANDWVAIANVFRSQQDPLFDAAGNADFGPLRLVLGT